jgi:SWI/SNF-related matrix-associated actin-dependent regulator 1 of chromatin subfamily A
VSGASNLAELQRRLRGSIMIRRLKKDVALELPPKVRQVIEIPAELVDQGDDLLQAEARLDARVELARLVRDAGTDGTLDEGGFRQRLQALEAGDPLAFHEIAAARKETALKKAPLVAAHLVDLIRDTPPAEDGRPFKVICFCHHKEVAGIILGAYAASRAPGRAVAFTGELGTRARQAAVDGFQADPEVRLIVGTMGAMGTGLTLTAASHVVFAEEDWTPSLVRQCEDRAHRTGQRDVVTVQHFVLAGSIDAMVASALVRKMDIMDRMLDSTNPADAPLRREVGQREEDPREEPEPALGLAPAWGDRRRHSSEHFCSETCRSGQPQALHESCQKR